MCAKYTEDDRRWEGEIICDGALPQGDVPRLIKPRALSPPLCARFRILIPMKQESLQTNAFVAERMDWEKQAFLKLIGAELTGIRRGYAEVSLPFRSELGQQHGFAHAGVITTLADSAAGYAAHTLMPAESEILSVEFKVNLLRPGAGERLVARARVLKPGRTLTITQSDVFAISGGEEKHVATMLATMICRQTPETAEGETAK